MTGPIELAPDWKRSLAIPRPLLLASGALAVPEQADSIGALVTLPLTLYHRMGAPLPRVVEIPGGALFRTGAANPGLTRVLRQYRTAWARSATDIPIIVALAVQGVRDWPAMAAQLERVPGVGGVELHLNPTIDSPAAIRATRARTDLPILAKLDLDEAAPAFAAECIAGGANSLVIGRPPRGAAVVEGRPWYGRLYAPSVKALVMRVLVELASQNPHAPLIASGGVYSAEDVRDFLGAGAAAVEIDAALWLNPGMLADVAQERKAV